MRKFELPKIEVIELEVDEIITCSDGGFTPGPKPPIDVDDPSFWDN